MRKNAAKPATVWVTADLFRFGVYSGQPRWIPERALKVLHTLVQGAIGWRTDVQIKILDHSALGFTQREFLDGFVDPTAADWARRYFDSDLSSLEGRLRELLNGQVVVCFEAPESLWNVFSRHSAAALDLAIHPCRFSSELFLIGRSVGFDLTGLVDATAFRRKLFWEASAFKGRLIASEPSNEPSRNLLLALQISIDRAVLAENGFAAIHQHAAELERLAADYDQVVVKPHPYGPIGTEDAESLLSLPNAVFTDGNIYRLMASEQIAHVCALSSSVIHEAMFFGVSAEALRADLSFGFPLRSEWVGLTLEDWVGSVSEALVGALPVTSMLASAPPAIQGGDPSLLRQLFGQTWGVEDAFVEGVPPPTLPTDKVSFSDPLWDSARTYGWATPEAWGVWAVGPLGVVSFTWPEEVETASLVIEMVSWAPFLERPTIVELWSGGDRVKTVEVLSMGLGPTRVVVQVPRPVYGEVGQIAFFNRSPDPSVEGDDRCFAVGLVSLHAI